MLLKKCSVNISCDMARCKIFVMLQRSFEKFLPTIESNQEFNESKKRLQVIQ